MPLHLPTLLTRTGSALVFGVVMLAAIAGPAWAFGTIFLLIHALCTREYFKLTKGFGIRVGKNLQLAAQVAGGILLLAFYLGTVRPGTITGIAAFVVLSVVLYPICVLLAAALSSKSSFKEGAVVLTGHLYITLPIGCLLALRFLGLSEGALNLPLLLMVCIWSNDSFAYLSGSLIGKTPLSPISPKKTWEGTAGGAGLTVGAAMLFSYFFPSYPFWLTIGFALSAAIAGTLGDLLESRLKRLAGVKDSGRLMPGHGGALDRFDSLLVATPFALVYFCLTAIYLRPF